MILYFADRRMNILGHASASLPQGFVIKEDLKSEDVETGIATFEAVIGFDAENRIELEAMTKAGNYLLRSHDSENEFYTITERSVDTKNQDITIYAEDAGLDLLNEIVGAFTAEEAQTAEWYVNKFTADSGFEIGVNEIPDTTTRKLSWTDDETVTSRLVDIASRFGGFEISYSFAIKGMMVTNKYINIHETRGKDTGETLFLNKDIDRIVSTESADNLATALKCVGSTPDGSDTPITLKGYEYDDEDIYVDGNLLKSRNALEIWSRHLWEDVDTGFEGHIIKTFTYDTTSQETLCNQAIKELKKAREVEINYEIDIKQLPANVRIGDRINIVDDAGELYVSTRILKLETSVIDQEQKATLGEHLIKRSGISQQVADLAGGFSEAAKDAEEAKKEAEDAQQKAEEAEKKAEEAEKKAEEAEQGLTDASANAQAAQESAEEAKRQAEEAAQAAAQAQADAADAEAQVTIAQSAAEQAETKAEEAKQTAEQAKTDAETASTTAAAAKIDAEKAAADIAALGEELDTVSQTMTAEYARKTDLTEAEANLQSQISQNAAQIESTVSQVSKIDETANNAAEQAADAQSKADAAQAKADEAVANANTAQQAADTAAQAAADAQTEADTAKSAADAAQTAADDAAAKAAQAEADLETAKQNLTEVNSRVDATEEEVEAAQKAVDEAQAAADQAEADAAAAQQAATEAKTSADEAQTIANNAKTVADEAQTAADEAQAAADKAQADVDALAVRVTEAETKITQTSEKIELMATKTEVEETLGGYYTKEETDAAIQIESDNIISKVSRDIESIEVGGRNLFENSGRLSDGSLKRYFAPTAPEYAITYEDNEDAPSGNCAVLTINEITTAITNGGAYIEGTFGNYISKMTPGDVYTVSVWAKCSTSKNEGIISVEFLNGISSTKPVLSTEWQRYVVTGTYNGNTDSGIAITFYYGSKWSSGDVFYVSSPKVEKGTKPTDWTPAPEDVDSDISDAAEAASGAQATADAAQAAVTEAESVIQQLSDSISTLVTDGNGASLMTQTESGWTFSTKELQDSVDSAHSLLNELQAQLGEADAVISVLQEAVGEHGNTLDYVNIGSYEDEPCIELGESENEMKVIITNTRIMFTVNGAYETYIDANGLTTDNITVNNEFRQAHHSWIVRQNGNYGLQNFWVDPVWNISERAESSLAAVPISLKELSTDEYYLGVTMAGSIMPSKISGLSISGDDITFTSATHGYGIGVPFHMVANASYTISCTASAAATLRVCRFYADGNFVTGSEVYTAAGTSLSLTFTAPSDISQFVMVIFDTSAASAGKSIKYSGITLVKN